MGWLSLFTGIASLTWLKLVRVDKFNTFVSVGYDRFFRFLRPSFAVMSVISVYMKEILEATKKY